jgi:hypothetical protein
MVPYGSLSIFWITREPSALPEKLYKEHFSVHLITEIKDTLNNHWNGGKKRCERS